MKVISTEKLPIKMWLDDIEDGALVQAKNLANLPFLFKWVSIMPDCHQGYGMPIGGVIAADGVVIVNAVGVDIGCGVCAARSSLTDITTESLKNIMGLIRKTIPVGFSHHETKQDISFMPDAPMGRLQVVEREFDKALTQIGTLGGGNHFIEIQRGDDDHIWIMIHSGSRNIGKQVADHYNKLAVEANEKWHSQVPKEWQLAFLPLDSQEGRDYVREMQYCVEFALANRQLMMDRVQGAIYEAVYSDGLANPIFFDPVINIAHNYAAMENHFGKNVLVHRKGATKATEGLTGIIPGSMGTASYIVEGLGNPDSFKSCSHGAGRKMGRKEAIRSLNLEDEQAKMSGIIGAPRSTSELDEAPGAYKDIDEVMNNQRDLVKVVTKLTPLAVIKG